MPLQKFLQFCFLFTILLNVTACNSLIRPVKQPAYHLSPSTFSNEDKHVELGARAGNGSGVAMTHENFRRQTTFVKSGTIASFDFIVRPVDSINVFGSYGTHRMVGLEYSNRLAGNKYLHYSISYSDGKSEELGEIYTGRDTVTHLDSEVYTLNFASELGLEYYSKSRWMGVFLRPDVTVSASKYFFSRQDKLSNHIDAETVLKETLETNKFTLGLSTKVGVRVLKYIEFYGMGNVMKGINGNDKRRMQGSLPGQFQWGLKLQI